MMLRQYRCGMASAVGLVCVGKWKQIGGWLVEPPEVDSRQPAQARLVLAGVGWGNAIPKLAREVTGVCMGVLENRLPPSLPLQLSPWAVGCGHRPAAAATAAATIAAAPRTEPSTSSSATVWGALVSCVGTSNSQLWAVLLPDCEDCNGSYFLQINYTIISAGASRPLEKLAHSHTW